jgi:hypothetical protein
MIGLIERKSKKENGKPGNQKQNQDPNLPTRRRTLKPEKLQEGKNLAY